MTAAQFDALAKLTRARNGAARAAAYMVLVDGHKPSAAAKLTGLSRASVSNALRRMRHALELARAAV